VVTHDATAVYSEQHELQVLTDSTARTPSMRGVLELAPLAVGLLVIAAIAASCAARPESGDDTPAGASERSEEITREQAIAIVRPQVKFEPKSIEAVAEEDEGRPVWRVTFRGRPPGPEHAMGEFQEFLVDRRTGEIVSLAMS
jgi:hypothetical protein